MARVSRAAGESLPVSSRPRSLRTTSEASGAVTICTRLPFRWMRMPRSLYSWFRINSTCSTWSIFTSRTSASRASGTGSVATNSKLSICA